MARERIVREMSERLAASGQRMTAQRRAVLDVLMRTRRSVTAPELYEQLQQKHATLGRATVFRTLDALVEAGLAQRFERPGHVYAYAACSPDHHHHLMCLRCNATTEIPEGTVAALVEQLRTEHGFVVEHESLDFYGTCRHCRPAPG